MSILELNKRQEFIRTLPLEKQKALKDKITEKYFWLFTKPKEDDKRRIT